jgi:hypothetical protein
VDAAPVSPPVENQKPAPSEKADEQHPQPPVQAASSEIEQLQPADAGPVKPPVTEPAPPEQAASSEIEQLQPADAGPVKPPATEPAPPEQAASPEIEQSQPAAAAPINPSVVEQKPEPPEQAASPEIEEPQPADATPVKAPVEETIPPESAKPSPAEPARASVESDADAPPAAEPVSGESGISDDPNLTTVLIETATADSLSGGFIETDDGGKVKSMIEDDFVDVASASSEGSPTAKLEKTNTADDEVLVEILSSDPDVF